MKLNRLFTSILLAGVLLTGCTTENIPDPEIGSSTTATLRFALGGSAGNSSITRAGGDATSATLDKEKTVNNVLALLFYEDGSGLYDVYSFDNTTSEEETPQYNIEVKESGSYNLYLVANATGDLRQQILNLTSAPETTLKDLGELLADQAPDMDNEFLMTSKLTYLFQATPGNSVDAGTIALRRLSLRIDLVNMMYQANITKVTFKRAIKSNLITGNAMPTDVIAEKEYDFSQNPIEGKLDDPGTLEGTIYGYENYSTDTPSTLKIDYTANGTPKSYTIDFKDPTSAEGGVLALKRNNFYRITLTDDMSVPYMMEVLDWEEAEAFTVDKLVTKLEPLAFTTNLEDAWFIVDPNNMKNAKDEELMTYSDTKGLCPSGWQMPTQSQLMMMWVYNDSKTLPHASKGIFMDANHYMWSSTLSNGNAYATSGKNGHTTFLTSGGLTYAMRCIKQNTNKKYPYLGEDKRTIISKDASGGIDDKALLADDEITYLLEKDITTSEYSYTQNSSYNHVSPKFKVATTGPNTQKTYAWNTAYNYCKNYTEESGENPGDKGKWRLPTQRELMLMYVMKSNTNSLITLSSNDHTWSGTHDEDSDKNACSMNSGGFMTTRSITGDAETFSVRCVRDIIDAKEEAPTE
ncbi:Lcl domain-containing protein [Parabacteroides sp.]